MIYTVDSFDAHPTLNILRVIVNIKDNDNG